MTQLVRRRVRRIPLSGDRIELRLEPSEPTKSPRAEMQAWGEKVDPCPTPRPNGILDSVTVPTHLGQCSSRPVDVPSTHFLTFPLSSPTDSLTRTSMSLRIASHGLLHYGYQVTVA